MPKIITLSDIKVNTWTVDPDNLRVIANYHFLDDQGNVFGDNQQAIFWVTIPSPGVDPEGQPIPVPDNWYQLPKTYLPTLVNISNDLHDGLINLVA